MKKRTWISALALGVILGSTLALPDTASAREFGKEIPAKVFKTAGRHGDMDRGHWERRKVTSHYKSKHRSKHNKRGYRDKHRHDRRHDHRHERRDYRPVKRHRGYGHKWGHHKQHHDRRDYRPVRQHRDHHRHREDGVRVHIDYDFRL